MMNPLILNCTDCGQDVSAGFMFPVFQILEDGTAVPSTLCGFCVRIYIGMQKGLK
jgi:hypothetical protein